MNLGEFSARWKWLQAGEGKLSKPGMVAGSKLGNMTEKNYISRIKLHNIESMTSDRHFLNGGRDGKPVDLAGELRLSLGAGPFPAMVLVQ
jgi:hypothetical protein